MMDIGVKLDQNILSDIIGSLERVKKTMVVGNLQVFRAKRFKKYAEDLVQRGEARLPRISGATEIISGDHEPEWITGFLLRRMKVKKVKGENAAEVGYFKDDTTKISKRGDTRLTVTQVAELQHTGYRIPLSGIKGAKVRAWFGKNYGIYFKADKQWLRVKARPFFWNAFYQYESSGEDIKAVEEYLDIIEKSFSGQGPE